MYTHAHACPRMFWLHNSHNTRYHNHVQTLSLILHRRMTEVRRVPTKDTKLQLNTRGVRIVCQVRFNRSYTSYVVSFLQLVVPLLRRVWHWIRNRVTVCGIDRRIRRRHRSTFHFLKKMLYSTLDERYRSLTANTDELLRDINEKDNFSRATIKVNRVGGRRSRAATITVGSPGRCND